MSLLDDAKKIESRNENQIDITIEDVELVCAYFRNEITHSQVRKVKNKDGVQIYSYLVRTIRKAVQIGKIVVPQAQEEE